MTNEIRTSSVGLFAKGERNVVIARVVSPIAMTSFRPLRSANHPQTDWKILEPKFLTEVRMDCSKGEAPRTTPQYDRKAKIEDLPAAHPMLVPQMGIFSRVFAVEPDSFVFLDLDGIESGVTRRSPDNRRKRA